MQELPQKGFVFIDKFNRELNKDIGCLLIEISQQGPQLDSRNNMKAQGKISFRNCKRDASSYLTPLKGSLRPYMIQVQTHIEFGTIILETSTHLTHNNHYKNSKNHPCSMSLSFLACHINRPHFGYKVDDTYKQ